MSSGKRTDPPNPNAGSSSHGDNKAPRLASSNVEEDNLVQAMAFFVSKQHGFEKEWADNVARQWLVEEVKNAIDQMRGLFSKMDELYENYGEDLFSKLDQEDLLALDKKKRSALRDGDKVIWVDERNEWRWLEYSEKVRKVVLHGFAYPGTNNAPGTSNVMDEVRVVNKSKRSELLRDSSTSSSSSSSSSKASLSRKSSSSSRSSSSSSSSLRDTEMSATAEPGCSQETMASSSSSSTTPKSSSISPSIAPEESKKESSSKKSLATVPNKHAETKDISKNSASSDGDERKESGANESSIPAERASPTNLNEENHTPNMGSLSSLSSESVGEIQQTQATENTDTSAPSINSPSRHASGPEPSASGSNQISVALPSSPDGMPSQPQHELGSTNQDSTANRSSESESKEEKDARESLRNHLANLVAKNGGEHGTESDNGEARFSLLIPRKKKETGNRKPRPLKRKVKYETNESNPLKFASRRAGDNGTFSENPNLASLRDGTEDALDFVLKANQFMKKSWQDNQSDQEGVFHSREELISIAISNPEKLFSDKEASN